MKKIAFLALHLGYGGAEKAIVAEANILVERYEVEIICAYKLNDKPAFELDERVNVTYLSETLKPNKDELRDAIRSKNLVAVLREGIRSLRVLYYRKASIRHAICHSDADVLVSTRCLYHALVATNKKPGVITIAQEHNHHKNDEKYIDKMVQSVRKIDYFMPVSKSLTEFYRDKVIGTKCVYIPHSLEYIPEEPSTLDNHNIVSVGRLSKEKGFPDLVKVFSYVAHDFPDWKLHIVGDGDEYLLIEQCIKEYKLQDRVILHGFKNKEYINELLSQSSIYVMTSFEEAFGIVLIEAQSFGIPCVAYDCAKGAHEIITDNENGYLVPDRNELLMYERIRELIEDEKLRKKMGEAGRQNSLKYAVDNIKKMWFEFLEQM